MDNTNQAPMRKDDDNDEDETIDSLAKSVMDFILLQEDDDTERDNRDNVPAIKKRRQRKKQRAIWIDDDGTVRRITPRQTVWYSIFILKPHLEDLKLHKIFRRRFRLPYAQFLGLVNGLRRMRHLQNGIQEK